MNRIYNPLKIPIVFRIRLVFVLGILFFLIGASAVILSIIELFQGRPNVYHYDQVQGGLTVENPFWPSTGKGFWLGLVWIATGLIGILASREWTPPSIAGFTIFACFSSVFAFYLMMTCIIPVQYDTKYSDDSRPSWQTAELVINGLLIAFGGIGFLLGSLTTLIGCFFVGYCADQRDRSDYRDDPRQISIATPRFTRKLSPFQQTPAQMPQELNTFRFY